MFGKHFSRADTQKNVCDILIKMQNNFYILMKNFHFNNEKIMTETLDAISYHFFRETVTLLCQSITLFRGIITL